MTVERTHRGATQTKKGSPGGKGARDDLHVRREKSTRAVDHVIDKTIKRYDEALRKLEKY